jgi:hypothetical protein
VAHGAIAEWQEGEETPIEAERQHDRQQYGIMTMV